MNQKKHYDYDFYESEWKILQKEFWTHTEICRKLLKSKFHMFLMKIFPDHIEKTAMRRLKRSKNERFRKRF